MNHTLDMLSNADNNLKNTNNSYEKATVLYKNEDNEFNSLSFEVNNICREFTQYEKSVKFYNEVFNAVDDYYENIYSIIDILKDINQYQENLFSNKEVVNLIYIDKRVAYRELLIPQVIDDMKKFALLCKGYWNINNIYTFPYFRSNAI